MRMIDADKIEYEPMLSARGNGQYEDVVVAYKDQIDMMPTIEERITGRAVYKAGYADGYNSAQPERKTGKWIIRETAFEDTEAKCSNCGFVTLVNEPENGLHMVSDLLFCPRCGSFNAMMEGEQP